MTVLWKNLEEHEINIDGFQCPHNAFLSLLNPCETFHHVHYSLHQDYHGRSPNVNESSVICSTSWVFQPAGHSLVLYIVARKILNTFSNAFHTIFSLTPLAYLKNCLSLQACLIFRPTKTPSLTLVFVVIKNIVLKYRNPPPFLLINHFHNISHQSNFYTKSRQKYLSCVDNCLWSRQFLLTLIRMCTSFSTRGSACWLCHNVCRR